MSDNRETAQPRLLLVAFECSPQHGSEWANGWQRVAGGKPLRNLADYPR